MEELRSLVIKARLGDLEAFSGIVRRFQDMAYGYAYSILGDFHLAQDTAQEAFMEAYCQLPKLRKPEAFAGWFRRIAFKHCDRVARRGNIQTIPLDAVVGIAAKDADPARVFEQREMQEEVLKAVRALPEHQRTTTTLFYINGYSQKDIAEFLEVPVALSTDLLNTFAYPDVRIGNQPIAKLDSSVSFGFYHYLDPWLSF